MIKFRHFAKISSNIFHIICQNLIRQFLKVTFNEIFCKLALFLFYGTPAYYIASGNSCWLLWPKCWLETEFDNRFRLRFSLLIQLILSKCVLPVILLWLDQRYCTATHCFRPSTLPSADPVEKKGKKTTKFTCSFL